MIKEISGIQLSEAQRLWLAECYENIYSHYIDPKLLKVSLHGKLPPKFKNYDIDSRLISGTRLNVLGVMYVDPDSNFLGQINTIILHLKGLILANPKVQNVKAENVGKSLNIEVKDVAICFQLMETIGKFMTSAEVLNDLHGYAGISLDSEEVFDEYLAYENLEDHMQAFFNDWGISQNKLYDELGLSGDDHNLSQPKINVKANTAFIIMAIDPEKSATKDTCMAIKEVFNRYGINAVRADEIEHQDKITDVILEKIQSSEFLISDLSGERPNVYYELGYAHAINKRPILFRQKGTKIHFDLAGYNIPEYDGVYDLQKKLDCRLAEMTGKIIEKK